MVVGSTKGWRQPTQRVEGSELMPPPSSVDPDLLEPSRQPCGALAGRPPGQGLRPGPVPGPGPDHGAPGIVYPNVLTCPVDNQMRGPGPRTGVRMQCESPAETLVALPAYEALHGPTVGAGTDKFRAGPRGAGHSRQCSRRHNVRHVTDRMPTESTSYGSPV